MILSIDSLCTRTFSLNWPSMNFCSHCGNTITIRIPEGDNRERHVCDQCDSVHYQNPRIIAGCIPISGKRILLCKRAIAPRLGYWTLPAGFLENGETVIQGALRECHEEARAQLETPTLFGMYDIPHINQVYIFYQGQLVDDSYAPGEESLKVELFHEHEVPWNELAFPVITQALEQFFSVPATDDSAICTGTINRRLR